MNVLKQLGLDLTPLRTSRDYRLVFTSQTVSGFGSFITYVSIPFQVAALTHDPLAVGAIGVCELVPLLVMAFVGGALADYVDRRVLVRGGEFALTALTGVLLINALTGAPHLWLLYVVAALSAGIDGVQRPALDAMIPRLVTPQELPATGALHSLGYGAAQLLGPTLAGLLISSFSLAWAYAFDLLTFGVSLFCLTLVRAVPPPPAADRPSIRSVVTGVRYAASRQELLGTYLVDVNAMFFGMPQALYPFLADQLGGPKILGLLYAAPAAGAMLATLLSGWTSRVHRHGLMVLIAAALWGLGIVGVGLSHLLWLTLTCLAFAGGADMISGIFRSIIWNQTIPDHLRGRLAGIEMLSYTTGPLLGQLRSGAMARTRLGVTGSIWLGGVLCIAGTATLAAALPRFLRYNGANGIAVKKAADEAWAARANLEGVP